MHIPQIEAVKPVFVVVPLDEDDDPVATAYSQVDTQPLPKLQEPPFSWSLVVAVLLFYTSALGVAILYAITYPSVTIDVLPIEKVLSTTTMLPVPTRSLAPVTLTESLSAKTTGRGHIDATRASGTLTFYNGEFSAQTIVVGTVFTGSDGVQVATDGTVSIPPAAPPFLAQPPYRLMPFEQAQQEILQQEISIPHVAPHPCLSKTLAHLPAAEILETFRQ